MKKQVWKKRFICILVITASMTCWCAATLAQHGHGSKHGSDSGHGHSAEPEKNEQSLETMVIQAERIEEYGKNNPQMVTTLSRQDIESGKFAEPGEAIDSMPGVEVKQYGGSGEARISIRGYSGAGGILVLIDGRPMTQGQYGGVQLGSLPIDIIESITVFKPPAPVWLGPGAVGGAVNIKTGHLKKKSKTEEKKSSTRLRFKAGSFGAVNGEIGYSHPLDTGSFIATAGAGHRDGRRINNDRDSGHLSVNWNHKTPALTELDINSRFYASEHGNPGPTDNPTPDARQQYKKGELDLGLTGFTGDYGEYGAKAYLDAVELDDESQYGYESSLETFTFGVKADTTCTNEKETQTFKLGGLFEGNNVDHSLTGDHHREKAALFSQYDKSFQPVMLSLGGRGEYYSDFGFFPAVTVGAGTSVTPKTTIKTNVGYSVKVPAFTQLYQPSHGSIDQVRGNPDLTEESVWSYDAGIEHRFSKSVSLTVTAFRSDHDDFIAYERGSDLIYRPVNVSGAYRQGVETTCSLAFFKQLKFDINYIFQDTENESTGKELSYAPEHKLKTSLKYTVKGSGTRIETIFRVVDDHYSDLENSPDGEIDAYTNVDLKINQPLTILRWKPEFFLNIKNLFDRDFEVHHGYPDDGFRFTIGMNVTL